MQKTPTAGKPCYLCGHEHKVMASWTKVKTGEPIEYRYLCHEDDHSCYTKHNRSEALKWSLIK